MLGDVTMVGFRFPDYAEGIEVSGWHLHFITEDRRRGGHVLDSRAIAAHIGIDPLSDLHVELPPQVDLDSQQTASSTRAAIERVEHGG
jgi:acetolactate decarboxylase